MKLRRVITFKAYPYFFKLHRDGQMPFTLRLFNPDEMRFKYLEEDWRLCSIKIRNTETSEWLLRRVKRYEHVPRYMGNWVIIHF